MNAQIKFYSDRSAFPAGWVIVTSWAAKQQLVTGRSEPVKGYALTDSDGRTVGFIETTKPLPRIAELLDGYTRPGVFMTARELMRDLLNAEDYQSEVYDVIIRVYYTEDFACK